MAHLKWIADKDLEDEVSKILFAANTGILKATSEFDNNVIGLIHIIFVVLNLVFNVIWLVWAIVLVVAFTGPEILLGLLISTIILCIIDIVLFII